VLYYIKLSLLSKEPTVTKVLHRSDRYNTGRFIGKLFAYFTDASCRHHRGKFLVYMDKGPLKGQGLLARFRKTLKFAHDM
jgi:hypothetical protein